MGKYLYTWNWGTAGGFNQAWADNDKEAFDKAQAIWPNGFKKHGVTSLQRIGKHGDKAVDRYFDSMSRD